MTPTSPRSQCAYAERRRVTRACDECRRKKNQMRWQAAVHSCTVYRFGAQNIMSTSCVATRCTDVALLQNVHTISRQTVAAMLHPVCRGARDAIEARKSFAECLLPNFDLNDPSIDVHLQWHAAADSDSECASRLITLSSRLLSRQGAAVWRRKVATRIWCRW